MITCPGCQKTLPDWAKQCQFCGSDTTKVARPVAQVKQRRPMSTDAAPWVFGAYYAVSAYYILDGIIGAVLLLKDAKFDSSELGMFGIVALVMCGITSLAGIGLLARVEFVRGVFNVIAFINILRGGAAVIGSFIAMPIVGAFAVITLLFGVITIAINGFMIFLIGETDKRAPNI